MLRACNACTEFLVLSLWESADSLQVLSGPEPEKSIVWELLTTLPPGEELQGRCVHVVRQQVERTVCPCEGQF